MSLINADPIVQEINRRVIASLPEVIAAATKAVYTSTPVLKALLTGETVVLEVEPVSVQIPPIKFRLKAG